MATKAAELGEGFGHEPGAACSKTPVGVVLLGEERLMRLPTRQQAEQEAMLPATG